MVLSAGMEVEILEWLKNVSFPPKGGSVLKTGTYRFPGVGQIIKTELIKKRRHPAYWGSWSFDP